MEKTFLVLEDEPALRHIYDRVARMAGIEARCFESPNLLLSCKDLRSLSKKEFFGILDSYSAIVTDGDMPYMGGIEFMILARESGYSKPMALISGNSSKERIDLIVDISFKYPGHIYMLQKPSGIAELKDLFSKMAVE